MIHQGSLIIVNHQGAIIVALRVKVSEMAQVVVTAVKVKIKNHKIKKTPPLINSRKILASKNSSASRLNFSSKMIR